MPILSRRHVLAAGGALAAAAAAEARADASPDLKGKSLMVTGAASGFGRLGALHYARSGARVWATMRNLPRPEAEELLKVAKAEKLDLQVLELDVLSDDSVAGAVAEAERRNGGPLDVLVNNAGIVISGPVEVQDLEAVRLAFDTNVFGFQRTARAVLPGMRARKSGLIVNVSSQQGRVVAPSIGVYSATKFAVESMSEQLAYELAPHGVEVTIIQPGGYPTNIAANGARYNAALRQRIEPARAAAYNDLVASMGSRPRAPGPSSPDPLDVPRAIAEIAAMPAGRRPLRRPVHPGLKPQEGINRVSREAQLAWLGEGPQGAWVKAVLD